MAKRVCYFVDGEVKNSEGLFVVQMMVEGEKGDRDTGWSFLELAQAIKCVDESNAKLNLTPVDIAEIIASSAEEDDPEAPPSDEAILVAMIGEAAAAAPFLMYCEQHPLCVFLTLSAFLERQRAEFKAIPDRAARQRAIENMLNAGKAVFSNSTPTGIMIGLLLRNHYQSIKREVVNG